MRCRQHLRAEHLMSDSRKRRCVGMGTKVLCKQASCLNRSLHLPAPALLLGLHPPCCCLQTGPKAQLPYGSWDPLPQPQATPCHWAAAMLTALLPSPPLSLCSAAPRMAWSARVLLATLQLRQLQQAGALATGLLAVPGQALTLRLIAAHQ